MDLSPIAAYRIRKLLHEHSNHLKFVAAPGAALRADILSDLRLVIESLYLEDQEIQWVSQKLETLISYHQDLDDRGILYNLEKQKVEQEIFWLLGFKSSSTP